MRRKVSLASAIQREKLRAKVLMANQINRNIMRIRKQTAKVKELEKKVKKQSIFERLASGDKKRKKLKRKKKALKTRKLAFKGFAKQTIRKGQDVVQAVTAVSGQGSEYAIRKRLGYVRKMGQSHISLVESDYDEIVTDEVLETAIEQAQGGGIKLPSLNLEGLLKNPLVIGGIVILGALALSRGK